MAQTLNTNIVVSTSSSSLCCVTWKTPASENPRGGAEGRLHGNFLNWQDNRDAPDAEDLQVTINCWVVITLKGAGFKHCSTSKGLTPRNKLT